MVMTLANYLLMEVKAKSYTYRHEKWFSAPQPNEFVSHTLSPSACSMLMVLSSSLRTLKEALAVPLFNTLWPMVAELLDEFLFNEVSLT